MLIHTHIVDYTLRRQLGQYPYRAPAYTILRTSAGRHLPTCSIDIIPTATCQLAVHEMPSRPLESSTGINDQPCGHTRTGRFTAGRSRQDCECDGFTHAGAELSLSVYFDVVHFELCTRDRFGRACHPDTTLAFLGCVCYLRYAEFLSG